MKEHTCLYMILSNRWVFTSCEMNLLCNVAPQLIEVGGKPLGIALANVGMVLVYVLDTNGIVANCMYWDLCLM